jgi:hypothetical protein
VVQECAWSKDPQAEALGGAKVAKVVRDDDVGLARHGDLNDHLVVGILEQRPPKEENLLVHGNLADSVDQSFDMPGSLPAAEVTKQRRLVLGDERNRDRDLEKVAVDGINDLVRSTQSRSPGSDEYRGVEHDPHASTVSRTIPSSKASSSRPARLDGITDDTIVKSKLQQACTKRDRGTSLPFLKVYSFKTLSA